MKSNAFRAMCVIALLASPVYLQQVTTQHQPRFAIVQNGKIGFIDQNGTLVIEPLFEHPFFSGSGFSEGLSPVLTSQGWGYINESGKLVLRTTFDRAGSFSEGLAPVCVAKPRAGKRKGDLKCGFIDKTGKIVIEPQFDKVDVFRDGLARVYVYKEGDPHSERVGFIDREGQVVIEPVFNDAYWFSEGLANVGLANGQRVYIDKTGKIVSNSDYEYTHAWFSEGLAPAKKGDKWGYVSKEWKFVIEPKFDYVAQAFSDGLAHVRVNGMYGFIDVTGRMVIPPRLDNPANFSEGLAAIQVDGKYGSLDRAGKLVIEAAFTSANPFKDGLAAVTKNEDVSRISCCWSKWDYIDKTGQLVWEQKSKE